MSTERLWLVPSPALLKACLEITYLPLLSVSLVLFCFFGVPMKLASTSSCRESKLQPFWAAAIHRCNKMQVEPDSLLSSGRRAWLVQWEKGLACYYIFVTYTANFPVSGSHWLTWHRVYCSASAATACQCKDEPGHTGQVLKAVGVNLVITDIDTNCLWKFKGLNLVVMLRK